ncbi:hypothetical protein [Nocardia noduli]|uniref:hypothetical protein n=1 Tax=Nocardia noduli TaxID=2815722 RepID=UPI001C226D91|nr:hypothetical protein [Nocardia noduli]
MNTTPVPVRFNDRDEDDDAVWHAHQRTDGRWNVEGEQGPVEWPYRTDELEFL